MGVGSQCHGPAALHLGNNRYPLYRSLGGPQGWSGQVWKISFPPGVDSWIVQPVMSHCTESDIPAHNYGWCQTLIFMFRSLRDFCHFCVGTYLNQWTWYSFRCTELYTVLMQVHSTQTSCRPFISSQMFSLGNISIVSNVPTSIKSASNEKENRKVA